ncbi:hypothetical protein V2J09_022946 [Rumex salicifolius]
MASPGFVAPISMAVSLFIVFHQSYTVSSDFLSPFLSPIFENVCKEVPCGKGSCKPTQNSMIPFECVCEPGWKQPLSADGFAFLPCVIPNCTINMGCSPTASPAPAPAPQNATKSSIFDVCSWDFCGSGTCNRSSNSSYSCSCSEGYDNLMNSTSLPCFRQCELGGDCKKLGLTLFNNTAHAPTANASNDSTNKAAPQQYDRLSRICIVALGMFIPVLVFA